MSFVVIIIIGIVAFIFALIGFKFLKSTAWVMGWLRGTVGLSFLALSALFVVCLFDVLSYDSLLVDKSVATLSLNKIGEQKYEATFARVEDGKDEKFEINGDQWQIDARIFRWGDALALVGVKPSYRLDRLAGRYFSLEKERLSDRTVYELGPANTWLDTWKWVNDNKSWVPGIEATYGSAIYLPMADGALFEILLSNKGLTARPLNTIAKKAIDDWK